MRAKPAALLVMAAGIGCASQGMPPGGPPDQSPPVLRRVIPESGASSVQPRTVEFQFSEVVSERPRGAPSLSQLVVISPTDGEVQVDWSRDRLVVRPSRGWRPNTAYTVTILPGLSDLRGNPATVAFQTVFSTGNQIPRSVIRGSAFDWMAGRHAPAARVEATLRGDSTFKWAIAADSSGRFVLGSLPADTFLVRGWIDMNNNGVRETREPWDTTTVALRDSARTELYAFARDTNGARLSEISLTDSVTVRVTFDHGLRPAAPLDGATIRIIRARDSSEVAIGSIRSAAAHDSSEKATAAARADSSLRADTTESGRRARASADSARRARLQDSLAQAQVANVRSARDTVRREPPPIPGRPVPPTEFVITTRAPLPEDVPLRLLALNVQALVGPPRSSDRQFTRRKPPPRDTTATKRPPATPPARPPR